MADHTSGPWKVIRPATALSGGWLFVRIGPCHLIEAEPADAHLIASAPTLLAALEEAYRLLDLRLALADIADDEKRCLDTVRAALAKAKGETA